MRPQTTLWFTLLITVSFLVVALTGVSADGSTAGGRIIGSTDPDVAMPYEAMQSAAVCYIDVDGSGGYYLGDSVALALQNGCGGNSGSSEIRLASWGDQPAGKRLGTGPDSGLPLVALPEAPRFHYQDADGSNSLTPGDLVYLKLIHPGQSLAAATDVRITPSGQYAAGSQVRSGDSDHGQGLTPLGTAAERIRLVDLLDTNTFEPHDLVYLTADTAQARAGPGDIRIYSSEDTLAYGSVVRVGDADADAAFRAVARDPCYVDADDNGRYGIGDTIYLALATDCTGAAAPGDVRLASGPFGAAGSRVVAGDDDHERIYQPLPEARIGFLGDDGTLDPGDRVVLDVSGSSKVTSGDILLTPTSRGSGVALKGTDPLVGSPLNDLGLFRDLTVFLGSSTRTSLFAHDVPYVSSQAVAGAALRPGDIRLVPVGEHPFGGPVGLETGEVPATLTRGAAQICSTKAIPNDYLPGDPVYLRVDGTCPATVRAGLIRLVAYADHEAFSSVAAGDEDMDISLTAVTGSQYKFVNAFTSPGWNDREALYIDLIAPFDRIDVGDIRLTPLDKLSGGHVVLSQDWDAGHTLTGLGTVQDLTAYVDRDADGAFDAGDHGYVTPKATQDHPTPLSVRLSSLDQVFRAPAVVQGDPEAEPTDDEGAATPSPRGDQQEPEQDLTNTPGSDDRGNTARTPVAGAAVLLAALAVVSAVIRRRG